MPMHGAGQGIDGLGSRPTTIPLFSSPCTVQNVCKIRSRGPSPFLGLLVWRAATTWLPAPRLPPHPSSCLCGRPTRHMRSLATEGLPGCMHGPHQDHVT